eukprot:scaffold1582_cov299-Ochromonas_danica.AAC.3
MISQRAWTPDGQFRATVVDTCPYTVFFVNREVVFGFRVPHMPHENGIITFARGQKLFLSHGMGIE